MTAACKCNEHDSGGVGKCRTAIAKMSSTRMMEGK